MLGFVFIHNICSVQKNLYDSIWSNTRHDTGPSKAIEKCLPGPLSSPWYSGLVTQVTLLCDHRPLHARKLMTVKTYRRASWQQVHSFHWLLKRLGTSCQKEPKGYLVVLNSQGFLTGNMLLVLGIKVWAWPFQEEGQSEAHGSRWHPVGPPRAVWLHLQLETSSIKNVHILTLSMNESLV